ncbi:DNA/RNA non-specific endonuclease [Psychroserpens sp.]|uniref:DNA/RNA non-specific endonuclease n=1 Tax=Psychroserpens sp. TaxID=2020870 RepID=UPI001B1B6075|nr:DNA/RNA non-specific endonuclease [Psychroserpens sp.]MBO6606171.1 DNA/RNA non-specific endonuclease [Psychroserpens sp.]MBO6632188.1 DNA/RNA non-specific endonuclease [Psychroserpens sp.]MBO6652457.1 DNA/RNA non-specific endonuclease [Psychroserpens sp.]MBO6681771.1 DNA/RNA non-specific endonuclease [Psychroserpens sp.]MBO6749546.1 DNA/RNA non-specific endonuclease [Psychroserpens sp.]
MTKKTRYSIIALVIVLAIFSLEFFLNKEEAETIVEEGTIVKTDTNEFFLPTSTTGQIVHHDGYSLSYSETHEQAEWVAYELKRSHLSNTNLKRPYFEIDIAVRTGAAHWRNYKNSGYDRGHLCPAADRKYSREAHVETFLTSNISPQKSAFNAGIWNTLEQKVRYWARKYDGVFVVTGGVLSEDLKGIGKEKVSVPDYFYKVLIDRNSGPTKMIAFLIPHEPSNRPLYEFVVSVDDIEQLTGIDFFASLDDTIEKKLEASDSYKSWSFN